MDTLFRQQVVERRRQRLYGDVVITDTRIDSSFVVIVALICAALLLWAISAHYARTERVTGIVTTERALAKLQIPRAGTIERLFVAEGSLVHKGAPIAYIGVDVRDAQRRAAAGDSLGALARQEDSLDQQISSENQSTRSERHRIKGALALGGGEQRSIDAQIGLQQDIVRSSEAMLARIMPIVEKGFISQIEHERRQQAMLAEKQRLAQLRQQRTQLAARQQDLAAQLERLPIEHERRVAELGSQREGLAQQKSRARVDMGYTVIAPITGRVTALQATAGRFADPRLPMMSLIPPGSRYSAELFVPSRAIGFIRPGQAVRLMYDAFPFKQFGASGGKITSFSRVIIAPAEVDAPLKIEEPVFRVRVALDRQYVAAYGDRLALQSGMTLTGNIILEQRTFLDWLLAPLNAVRRRT